MSNKISTRTGFGNGLLEIASDRKDIIVTSADTYRSFELSEYVDKYTDRYFEFGIAEQCMITASGAMAEEGFTVFSVGYSPFLSMRALEQIRTFVAYPNFNVKIVAGLSGLSGDTDGVTHQGTEDLAIVRSIPNMTVICPADAVAAKAFVKIAADDKSPVYLRLGRGATPVIYSEDQIFVKGKNIVVRNYGNDFAVFATGPCVAQAVYAAENLHERGINIKVIDVHTLKPLDEKSINDICAECKNILTVEDGTIYGGLGSAVAETLVENNVNYNSFKRFGLQTFGAAGNLDELLSHFNLDSHAIEKYILNLLNANV